MIRLLPALMCLALLAGCSGLRKSGDTQKDTVVDIPSREDDSSQVYSLPGIPMKYMPPSVKAKTAPKPAEAEPAETPEKTTAAQPAPPDKTPAAAPRATGPGAPPSGDSGDLLFHMNAAKRYAAGKKYLSAAAEFGAALPFLPPGDSRAVYLLERKGAMLLRAGKEQKAGEAFSQAIDKAAELKTAGNDLANSYLGLAYCLEKKGDIPSAIDNYEKALRLSRSRTVKARITKTLDELKSANKKP